MKNQISIFLVLFNLLIPFAVKSQQLSIVMPGTVCLNQSVFVSASHSLTGSANCVWSVTPAQSITSLGPFSDQIGVFFGSCGMHTLTCNLYDNVTNNLLATAIQTLNVLCQSAPSLTLFAATLSLCPGYTVMATVLGATSYTWLPGSQTQNSISAGPGNYTVMGTNSVGCVSRRTFSIGTSAPLAITVTQSSLSTCLMSNSPPFSKPVQLTFSGASTYALFPYNPNIPANSNTATVRPATSTCYTVIGSVPNCSGTAMVCVNVIPQFSISLNKNQLLRCHADTAVLAVTNVGTLATGPASAYTYSWTEGLNAPPISMSGYFTPTVLVYPQNTTTYTVQVYDAAGCVSSQQLVNVFVSACTGLNEKQNTTGLEIYPNPSSGLLNFRGAEEDIRWVELTDVTGKSLIRLTQISTSAGSDRSLDISYLSPGIYFLNAYGEKTTYKPVRIIKE